MKASELRLGVNVLYKGQIILIDDCERIGDCYQYPNDYNGIPLTEEWLLKFGFERFEGESFHNEYYLIDPAVFGENTWNFRKKYSERESISLGYIHHVHQLQNLYFALTGEELTASQSKQQ